MVSHDVEFLRGAANVILEVRDHHVTRYPGTYDYYRERIQLLSQKTEEKQGASATSSVPVSSDSQKERRKERAARRAELSRDKKRLERSVADLEKTIEEAEAEKSEIIARLSAPSEGTDFAALQKNLSLLERKIEEASARWETDAEALELLMKEYREIREV